jgi:hypothetical protein
LSWLPSFPLSELAGPPILAHQDAVREGGNHSISIRSREPGI